MADERESDQGQRDTFVRREGARDNQEEQSPQRVRLQRYLADAGVAARRACEEMIEEGRVEVNGEIITKLPAFVDPQHDKVRVDGRAVAKPQSALTLLVHKPQRVLVTASDEPGMDRATILDLVNHPAGARLFPVGRLGWDDAGLVVLTNDGELANALSHPRFGVPKRYEVLVAGAVGQVELAKIRRQAKLLAKATAFEQRREQKREQGEGPLFRRAKAKGDLQVVVLDQETQGQGQDMTAGKTVLGITMGDAKGKPLRDILHGAGLPVRKLTRVAIGPLTLRGLKVGAWREVTRDELRVLRAIIDDGSYSEHRAMKLMEKGDRSLRDDQRAGPFWPAPVLRQEAMKQQRANQPRGPRKPRSISDQLLEERMEEEPRHTAKTSGPRAARGAGGLPSRSRDDAQAKGPTSRGTGRGDRPARGPQGGDQRTGPTRGASGRQDDRQDVRQAPQSKQIKQIERRKEKVKAARVLPRATPRGQVPPGVGGGKRQSPMNETGNQETTGLIKRRKATQQPDDQ